MPGKKKSVIHVYSNEVQHFKELQHAPIHAFGSGKAGPYMYLVSNI